MKRSNAFSINNGSALDRLIAHLRFQKITKHISKDARVLDLGCGHEGALLHKISANICEGVGVDMIASGKAKCTNIRLVEHNLINPLPFPDNTFDIVVSLANLEHLPNPEQVMQEIARVLKPSGKLLLTTPTPYARPVLELLAFKLHLISKEEIADHKHYFSKKELLELCQKNNFTSYSYNYFQCCMNGFLIAEK